MSNEYSVVAHFPGSFDEVELARWVQDLRKQLRHPPNFGLVFTTPQFFPYAQQMLEIIQVHGHVPLLAGCSATSLIAQGHEIEKDAGLVLGLYHLPDADLKGIRFTQEQVEEASTSSSYWHYKTGVSTQQTNGWLVFADPFHLNAEEWVHGWDASYPGLPTLGGMASGDFAAQVTQVYLNRQVFEEGGVAVSFGGSVGLASVISQGCTPIGETWTITRAERNFIMTIANQPAYKVLLETYNGLPADEQKKARGNLFVGLVVNEYLDDYHRGDFLIRNLLGADPNSGVLAIGALPRIGQTIQFQRRDAMAATEDLDSLLNHAHKELEGETLLGGCLCSCNGRGQGLFNMADHDAKMIQDRLGPVGVAGFFCNGEIGPVGSKNFIHGYTASLALFVKKHAVPNP